MTCDSKINLLDIVNISEIKVALLDVQQNSTKLYILQIVEV
jgi:hypothetical protein